MNSLREAAQQALEALEKTHTQPGCEQWQAERKASVALRAALAQQEPNLRNANPIGLTPPQKALQQAQFRADSLAQEEQEQEPMSQPKALFLADVIKADPASKTHHDEAAAELRRLSAVESRYNELLFAVGSKQVGETRHDTALRYIKRAEDNITYGPAKAEGEQR
jgi:hypothetical protein